MIIENPHEEKVILGKAIFIPLLHVNCTLPVALTQKTFGYFRYVSTAKEKVEDFIYLSKSVFTIFSKVSSHLRSGLVIPHCRDLLYSFKPKYSFSSQLMSS